MFFIDRQTIESIGIGLTQYNSASDLIGSKHLDLQRYCKNIFSIYREQTFRDKG